MRILWIKLRVWWYMRTRGRVIQREVERSLKFAAATGGLAFDVGDRVQAIEHDMVDDSGGYGVVTAVHQWHPELECFGVHVKFDSFSEFSMWFPASHLQYERL